jgi:hypothetical protein
MNRDALLAWYATPGPFTTLGPHAGDVDRLPDDVAALAKATQSLLLHRFWAAAYGVEVTPERDREQGLHGAEAMLDRALRHHDAPVGAPREPGRRVVGICRHFATLLCAFLRHKGVPARARCGFATYFEPGKFGDHWVCEYWRAGDARWVMVDAQLDALQLGVLKPDFDPLDVPRDRFIVAGAGWRMVRSGEADGALFGIADMWGDWYIRGNLAIDIASLQKVELLPWEPFGIARSPEAAVPDTPELLDLVDHTAALTALGDDASVTELLALAARDARLRPPEPLLPAALAADAAGPAAGNPVTVQD